MAQEDVMNDIGSVGGPRKSAPSQDTGIPSNPSTAVEDNGEKYLALFVCYDQIDG